MIKRKKELESDKDVVYCPRKWCQGAARSKKHPKPSDPLIGSLTSSPSPDSDSESEEEAPPEVTDEENQKKDKKKELEIIMANRLAICEDCSYAWCKRCSKSWHGDLLICRPNRDDAEISAEEKASQEYMRCHTSPCPTCSAPCQKTHGCNHLICPTCETHFCYLCSSWLDERNPYQHFNEAKSGCYQRLWELEGGDGGEVGLGFEGGDNFSDSGSDDGSDGEDEPVADMELPVAVAAQPPAPLPRPQPANMPPMPPQAPGGNRARRQNPQAPAEQRQPNIVGLQRFLQMVDRDEEDEWDSDELGDEFDLLDVQDGEMEVGHEANMEHL
jgi:E3 ubiquitin-protein ligase RNF14